MLKVTLPAPSVTFAVRTDAKCNQVVHHIATEPSPWLHVMDLQAFPWNRTLGTASYLSRSRTRFRTMVYSFAFGLSLGCF